MRGRLPQLLSVHSALLKTSRYWSVSYNIDNHLNVHIFRFLHIFNNGLFSCQYFHNMIDIWSWSLRVLCFTCRYNVVFFTFQIQCSLSFEFYVQDVNERSQKGHGRGNWYRQLGRSNIKIEFNFVSITFYIISLFL